MTRLRSVLVSALLVLSGAVLALAIQHLIAPRGDPGSPAVLHAAILAEMDTTLNLTAAQRDSIQAIFVRHQALVDSAWRTINQRVDATMDSVHRELQRVLDPSQQAAFHEWMRRQHGRHELRHQRR